MIRACLAAVLLLAAGATSLPGQDHTITRDDVRRLRPQSCAIADSIVGVPLTRPKEYAYGYWRSGSSALFSNDPFALTGGGAVQSILLTAIYQGEGPAPEASYGVQLRFVDRVLREGSGTRIVLVLDDSLRLDLGESDATSTPWSRGDKIDQIIMVPVPTMGIRALIRARSVKGSVGPTEFPVPPKTLEGFRSVFLAASCGTKLH